MKKYKLQGMRLLVSSLLLALYSLAQLQFPKEARANSWEDENLYPAPRAKTICNRTDHPVLTAYLYYRRRVAGDRMGYSPRIVHWYYIGEGDCYTPGRRFGINSIESTWYYPTAFYAQTSASGDADLSWGGSLEYCVYNRRGMGGLAGPSSDELVASTTEQNQGLGPCNSDASEVGFISFSSYPSISRRVYLRESNATGEGITIRGAR